MHSTNLRPTHFVKYKRQIKPWLGRLHPLKSVCFFTGRCNPQDVIINIKHGSYPAVNPDGYSFPKGFVDPATRDPIHTVELLSDGKNTTYVISNPKPGNWYALAYRKWEDPRTQKVEQQGLYIFSIDSNRMKKNIYYFASIRVTFRWFT